MLDRLSASIFVGDADRQKFENPKFWLEDPRPVPVADKGSIDESFGECAACIAANRVFAFIAGWNTTGTGGCTAKSWHLPHSELWNPPQIVVLATPPN